MSGHKFSFKKTKGSRNAQTSFDFNKAVIALGSVARRRVFIRPALAVGLTFMLISSFSSRAHEGKPHGAKAAPAATVRQDQLKSINEAYLKSVKAIFQRSCFDCHSSSTNFPWYSNLPGAKQLIQNDIKEAKEHMDMSEDFPFKGHSSPKEDLEAIKKAVNGGSMPPFRYRIMHSSAELSAGEKKKVQDWVDSSLNLFE